MNGNPDLRHESAGLAGRPGPGHLAASLSFVLLASCGIAERPPVSAVPVAVEPGLSSVRSLNAAPSEDLGHDAISDGPESCPRSGRADDDPLEGRPTHCAELGPAEPPAFATTSRRPARGLPPVRSVCTGDARALVVAPFELAEQGDGKILRTDLTVPVFIDQDEPAGYSVAIGPSAGHDETWRSQPGRGQIACLPLDQ